MSSDMEQGMPDEPETPRHMSPEELDQALRWLEDLAAGRSTASRGDAAKALDDSPFRSLFELEEGDLPDWLREAPTEGGEGGLDMESRLDWLAKMASRESIEELPTLEWRRLTSPEQASVIREVSTEEASTVLFPIGEEAEGQDAGAPAEAEEAGLTGRISDDQGLVEAAVVTGMMVVAHEDDEADTVPMETPELEPVVTGVVISETLVEETEPGETVLAEVVEVEVEQAGGVVETEYVETVQVYETPQGEAGEPPAAEIPELDDMDAAMAWLEELAANQNTPIEDLPSVADRALASKLMAEASQVSAKQPVVEVPSPTPGASVVEETPSKSAKKSRKKAAAVAATAAAVAVAGDEGPPSAPEAAVEPVAEPAIKPPIVASEQAAAEPPSTVAPPVVAPAVAAMVAAAAAPEPPAVPEPAVAPPADRGLAVFDLGSALGVLDRIAIQKADVLGEIEAKLEAEGPLALATPYSLDSTLDWLLPPSPPAAVAAPVMATVATADIATEAEAVAVAPAREPLAEMGLVDEMPDDPDAALDWMRQFADDEPVETVSAVGDAEAIEVSDSMLMEMPEDPDEAIAWLERLAAQTKPTNS